MSTIGREITQSTSQVILTKLRTLNPITFIKKMYTAVLRVNTLEVTFAARNNKAVTAPFFAGRNIPHVEIGSMVFVTHSNKFSAMLTEMGFKRTQSNFPQCKSITRDLESTRFLKVVRVHHVGFNIEIYLISDEDMAQVVLAELLITNLKIKDIHEMSDTFIILVKSLLRNFEQNKPVVASYTLS